MKKHVFTLVLLTLLLTGLFAKGAMEESAADDGTLTIYCYDTFSSEWGSGPTLIPLFEEKTGINTMTAEQPMTCVAIGTGKFVEFLSGKRDDD